MFSCVREARGARVPCLSLPCVGKFTVPTAAQVFMMQCSCFLTTPCAAGQQSEIDMPCDLMHGTEDSKCGRGLISPLDGSFPGSTLSPPRAVGQVLVGARLPVGLSLEPQPAGKGGSGQTAAYGVYGPHGAFSSALWTQEAGSEACPASKMTATPKGGGGQGPWSGVAATPEKPNYLPTLQRACVGGTEEAGFRFEPHKSTPTTGQARPGCSPRIPPRNSHKNERIYQHGCRAQTPAGQQDPWGGPSQSLPLLLGF